MAEGTSAKMGGHDAEVTLPLGLPRPFDVVAHRYLVEREIGGGSMGIVLAALDRETDRHVAIKCLKGARAQKHDSSTRFLQEVRATRTLQSDYVVRVLDVGMLEGGAPYFVMEHLVGENMLERLQAHATESVPMPVRDVVDATVETCAAMDEAHARGIVHRDLKPANLFRTVDDDGRVRVKVLDFGISKVIEHACDHELTDTTDMLGSPHYMSPEQLRSAKHVDHRTDIWSLGVVLHRLLTNAPPFAGATMKAVGDAVLSDDPPPPSMLRADVPVGLDAIVARCLERDPNERYPSAAALGHALLPYGGERARRAAATFGQSTLRWESPRGPSTSRRRAIAVTAIACSVLSVIFGIVLAHRSASGPQTTTKDPDFSLNSSPSVLEPKIATAASSGNPTDDPMYAVAPIVTASAPLHAPALPKIPPKLDLSKRKKASPGAAVKTSTSPWGSVIDDRK